MGNVMNPVKLLIVEDDKDFSDSLVGIASMIKVEIQTAFNLKSAITKLHDFNPDIILLDLKLGRDNGLDLFESINVIKRPIVTMILTAYATKDNAITALKEGAFNYIEKSLSPEEILDALQEAYDRIRLELLVFTQQNSLEDLVKERTQELEESQEMYQSLAKASPVGLLKIDNNGNCVFVNEMLIGMLGWLERDFYRMGWMEFIDFEQREEFKCTLQNFLSSGEKQMSNEVLFDCDDGNAMYILLDITRVNGGGKGYVVSATNISAQKMLLPKLLGITNNLPG